MSWHFLQEQEEASWAASCLDGVPDALSKLIPMPGGCFWRDNAMECYPDSQSGTTFRPSTEIPGKDTLTSSVVDSHVKILAQLEQELESPANDPGCGEKWPESWVTYCPDTSSWKTRQYSLLAGSESFWGTWPRWGTMRNGACWAHIMSEHPTNETGSGFLLPTPSVSTHWSNRSLSSGAAVRWTLHGMAAKNKWPTPSANDWKGSSRPGQRRRQLTDPAMGVIQAGGKLNPTWVAWLMGWPIGWTDLEPLEMDKFQLWRRSHGKP